MSSLVIDASVSAVWFLEDEAHPVADATFRSLDIVEAIVPQIWQFEIRNLLILAARRGRIQWHEIGNHLNSINELKIQTDHEPDLDAAMELALTHNLTFYDALYLELAKRRNAKLATLDNAMARAASNEGLGEIS